MAENACDACGAELTIEPYPVMGQEVCETCADSAFDIVCPPSGV